MISQTSCPVGQNEQLPAVEGLELVNHRRGAPMEIGRTPCSIEGASDERREHDGVVPEAR